MINYKTIGESLAEDEYNAIIYLLRNNKQFTDNINVQNNTAGEYGSYIFNLESATIIDDGVLITNETLTNLGTVKLVDPVFINSNYTLYLKVYSYEDIGIMDKTDITETELVINLVKNTPVTIPFNTLDLNTIVGFDARVEITHDKPVITYYNTLGFDVSDTTIEVNNTLILTATYTDNQNIPIPNQRIDFYNNTNKIGSTITDGDGIAEFEYTPESTGSLSLSCDCENDISETINVTVTKQNPTLTLTGDWATGYIPTLGDTKNLVGSLTLHGAALAGRSVKLYDGATLVDTLTTDNNGNFSKSVTWASSGTYNYKIVYEGTTTVLEKETSYAVNVQKKIPTITLNTNKTQYTSNESMGLYGTLKFNGADINNATVKIYNGDTFLGQTTTVNGGWSLQNQKANILNKEYSVVFEGDNTYQQRTTTKNIIVNKISSTITLSSDYTGGNIIPLNVKVNNNNGNKARIKIYLWGRESSSSSGIETDTNGILNTTLTIDGDLGFTIPIFVKTVEGGLKFDRKNISR